MRKQYESEEAGTKYETVRSRDAVRDCEEAGTQ